MQLLSRSHRHCCENLKTNSNVYIEMQMPKNRQGNPEEKKL